MVAEEDADELRSEAGEVMRERITELVNKVVLSSGEVGVSALTDEEVRALQGMPRGVMAIGVRLRRLLCRIL